MVKNKNHQKIFTSIVLIIVLIDQFTKFLIKYFNPRTDINILKIHIVKNTGAGFGILQGKTHLLAIISLIVAIYIIIKYKDIPKEKKPQILFALLLGGIIGNLIDRLFRGYVIDFIDFGFWPSFNIADAAISISVISLIWYYWKE